MAGTGYGYSGVALATPLLAVGLTMLLATLAQVDTMTAGRGGAWCFCDGGHAARIQEPPFKGHI
jgi:hypothetical protein